MNNSFCPLLRCYSQCSLCECACGDAHRDQTEACVVMMSGFPDEAQRSLRYVFSVLSPRVMQ